jgi:hypothetical protein
MPCVSKTWRAVWTTLLAQWLKARDALSEKGNWFAD